MLILTVFRLPDHVGNIANWTETLWEAKKIRKTDMKLPSLCNATKVGPITFPEKFKFSTLTHLCKSFRSKVFVIENRISLQHALDLTEDIDCDDSSFPGLDAVWAKTFTENWVRKQSFFVLILTTA